VVAEEQHFQRAAQRLNLAQSALSRRMRDLERDLGNVPLFRRTGRGVCLTPSGEALLLDARRILAQIEETKERTIAVMNGEAGVIRLGYTVGTLRHRFLQGLINASRVALPAFDFHASLVTAEQLVQHLRGGELQAGVIYGGLLEADLASLDVATEKYHLAIPSGHALARLPTVRFQQVLEQDLIWYSRAFEPAMHAHFIEAFRARGAIPKIIAESPTADTTLRWVALGVGLAFVPQYEQAWTPPGVTFKAVEDFTLAMSFRLVWMRQIESAILPRLIQAMTQAVAANAPEPPQEIPSPTVLDNGKQPRSVNRHYAKGPSRV
jgi:DNA-binding transcriptional LysR family regulator